MFQFHRDAQQLLLHKHRLQQACLDTDALDESRHAQGEVLKPRIHRELDHEAPVADQHTSLGEVLVGVDPSGCQSLEEADLASLHDDLGELTLPLGQVG